MFETKINTGADDAIQQLNDIYLGPILRVRKGQKVRIRFKNKLPEKYCALARDARAGKI